MFAVYNAQVIRNSKKVLDVPSFEVSAGATVLLTGANGSGKSTFLSAVFGVHDAEISGSLLYKQTDILDLSTLEKTKLGLYYVTQQVPSIAGVSLVKLLYTTSEEKVAGLNILEYKQKIEDKITRLGLDSKLLTASIGTDISGGQKKQMEMIGLVASRRELVFLDEIDSGVDIETQKVFANVLNSLKNQGISFVVVTHNSSFKNLLEVDATYICTEGSLKKII